MRPHHQYHPCKLRLRCLWILILAVLSLTGNAQNTDTLTAGGPFFVNDGETLIYHIHRDPKARQGTVSDALQNVPGVKVDTEGNLSLRGVEEVELFINGRPSHFDEESLKNYLQQVKATSIERIEVMTNPSAQYTSATNTGVINIITNQEKSSEQHLSFGFQANTRPNLSPSISYIWNNERWSFHANLKGGFSSTKEHEEGYSYSFVDHLVDSIPVGMDTATVKKYYSNDTTLNYSAELFLKAEYRPDAKNGFMTYISFTPSKSQSASYSNTYRHEYIDDIGEYDYDIINHNNQLFHWGSAGMSWHHRFDKPGQYMSMELNSDFDFGGGTTQETRIFKDQPELNRDIKIFNDFTDIGYNAKIDYVHPYRWSRKGDTRSQQGEIYLSITDNRRPDNNIGRYDTLGTDGYVTDWNRSENRRFTRHQTAGTMMVQHHFGEAFTVKSGVSVETTWIKSRYFDTPQYDTLMRFTYLRPSLHLSYRTPSMHNFSFSYTRKTDYPWVRYFTRRKDYEEESFTTGNPSLKPTLVDVFELAWAKYDDRLGSVNVKGYFNNSIHAINMVSDVAYDPLWGRPVPFRKPVNLNQYYEAGGSFNLTYRPSALFNVRLEANLYDSHIETYYEKTQDSLISSDLWAYSLRIGSWCKLWNKLELHATAYYSSPTQTLFATSQTAYGIDCGLRADFFDNRLSLLFNAFDIFNWNKEDNNTYNPYYISYSSNKANSRYLSVEVVYKVL